MPRIEKGATGSPVGHSYTDLKVTSRQRRDPRGRAKAEMWSTNIVCDPDAKGLYFCSSRQGGSEAIFGCSGLQNQKKTRRFYGFTDLRGMRLDRGRCSHATDNQNVAGGLELGPLAALREPRARQWATDRAAQSCLTHPMFAHYHNGDR